MNRGKAHGKVILFGEHAVVYGVPALAVGIERGAWAEAKGSEKVDAPSTLSVKAWGIAIDEEADVPLGRAVRAIVETTRAALRTVGSDLPSMTIEAGADLPPGGGLGCSAALGVAVARALDPNASPEIVSERADAWERVFHGNPSGIDAAVAALGGCVMFQRRDAVRSIEPVALPTSLVLCIGNTGQASSTKAMVDAVARIHERRRETTEKTFEAIHALARNARLALAAGDVRAVGQLLDLNQMLLASLLVSTPDIEQMCSVARARGALGAKLTGAGGGGSVVALVADAAVGQEVLEGWKSDGFSGFVTTVGSNVSAPSVSRPSVHVEEHP